MRGGAHRSMCSHGMAFDATPGPPATLLPATLDKLSSYKIAVKGAARKNATLHVVRGNAVQTLLAFYKQNNHFYTDMAISEEPVLAYSASAFADAVLDLNDAVPMEHINIIDRDQSCVGSESDSVVEDEGEIIERSMFLLMKRVHAQMSSKGSLNSIHFRWRRNVDFLYEIPKRSCGTMMEVFAEKCFRICSRLAVAFLGKIV
ncbi:hypothetical protein PHMEG_0005232 [Phytophthora megakarya]|uniref:DUF6570 domain-containing protein n=1 Tax=Phytophthora megakarya TaxID=4795 RepID=A0A225WTY4_9STRA|nr:hypothetical protein PHMEG_0005232 [Phytophthora megakarya]